MSTSNDGGLAFPVATEYIHSDGMTLRDYFAAKALCGMWANTQITNSGYIKNAGDPAKAMAINAYEQADAMLAARNATGGKP